MIKIPPNTDPMEYVNFQMGPQQLVEHVDRWVGIFPVPYDTIDSEGAQRGIMLCISINLGTVPDPDTGIMEDDVVVTTVLNMNQETYIGLVDALVGVAREHFGHHEREK